MKFSILKMTLIAGIVLASSCKKDRSTVIVNNTTGGTKPPVSHAANPATFFSKLSPKTFTGTFDASSGYTLVGPSGSKYYFQANSLVTQGNAPVTGVVNYTLIEYNTKADMLFSGVTVTTFDDLLESGGMFYLMVKQNGQELKLKNGSTFSIKVPQTNNNNEPMLFWNGVKNEKDSLNKVRWEKAEDSVVVKPQNDSAFHKPSFSFNFNYFQFGYCNIDREMNRFKDKVKKFKIRLNDSCNQTNSTALLLFKQYNSCAWCYWFDGYITTGYALPIGETVKVLTYRKTGPDEDDIEYAVIEYTLLDDSEVVFDKMTPCTFEELSNIIKGL